MKVSQHGWVNVLISYGVKEKIIINWIVIAFNNQVASYCFRQYFFSR